MNNTNPLAEPSPVVNLQSDVRAEKTESPEPPRNPYTETSTNGYAASKAGLFGLTKSLALEMARRGITVNTVAPGFIETEMIGQIPQSALDAVIEKIPQRRLGRPEEVARVVQFLLEDDSSYITGAVYTINGGLDM